MESLHDCVHTFLSHNGLDKQIKVKRIAAYWPAIVGTVASHNSYVISIEPPVLTIGITSSPWMQQFLMNRYNILKQVNDYYGSTLITDVKLKLVSAYNKNKEKTIEQNANKYMQPLDESIYGFIDLQSIRIEKSKEHTIDKSLEYVTDKELKQTLRKFAIGNARREIYYEQNKYKKCASCGSYMSPNENFCVSCKNKEERIHIGEIKKWLKKNPSGIYEDLNNEIPSTMNQFLEAKRELLYYYMDRIYNRSEDKVDLYMTTMLITGKKIENLTDEFVTHITSNFKRNKFNT